VHVLIAASFVQYQHGRGGGADEKGLREKRAKPGNVDDVHLNDLRVAGYGEVRLPG
jgi:hypothetical protein